MDVRECTTAEDRLLFLDEWFWWRRFWHMEGKRMDS